MHVWKRHKNMSPCNGRRVNTNYEPIASSQGHLPPPTAVASVLTIWPWPPQQPSSIIHQLNSQFMCMCVHVYMYPFLWRMGHGRMVRTAVVIAMGGEIFRGHGFKTAPNSWSNSLIIGSAASLREHVLVSPPYKMIHILHKSTCFRQSKCRMSPWPWWLLLGLQFWCTMYCGIWDWCIVRFLQQVYCLFSRGVNPTSCKPQSNANPLN